MKTEKIIYKLLTENTGEHFLDSGGAYGRHWQRNQKKSLNDFRKEKYISYDSDGYATKSLFHHLIESIDYLKSGFYPKIYGQRLKEIVQKALHNNGVKRIAARWEKLVNGFKESDDFQVKNDDQMQMIIDMYNTLPEKEKI